MSDHETNRRAFLASAAASATALASGRAVLGSAAQESASGLLVFTYDDGPEEDYTRAYEQAHKPEGVPGCSAVPSARVGGNDLSSDQMQEMAGDGWEFMSHGVVHRALAPISLTRDAAPGDTRLYVRYDFHGKVAGDTIEITDGETSEVATVAGRGGDYITLENPIENAYRVSDGAFERYTEDVVRTALGDSKAQLESEHGVDVSSIVMPYAAYGARTQSVVGDYYTAVANAGGAANWDRRGLNPVDRIDLPELSRAMLESDQTSDAEVESFLDRVASEDVLGIFGGHTWRHDRLPPERIRWAIQEAKDRGIEVVTLAEALDRLGFTGGGTTTTTTTESTTTTTTETTTQTTTTTETSTTTSTTQTTTTTETPTTSTTRTTTRSTTTEPPTTTSPTTRTTETPTTTTTQPTTTRSSGGGGGGGGSSGSQSSGGGGGQSFDPTTTTPTTTKTTTTTTRTTTPTTTTTTPPSTTTTQTTTTTPPTTETTSTATSSTAATSTTSSTAADPGTASGGQPGFGVAAALGGLAGAVSYYLRGGRDDE